MGLIDTHHHMVPPFFVKAAGEAKIAAVMPGGRAPQWTPQQDLEVMDRHGIDKAIVSISPGVWADTPQAVVALAREVNEYGAGMVRDRPARYGHFACLPLPQLDASLQEIAYAFDVLKADGIVLFTSYDGRYLGDAYFAPLFDELQRRNAVVFVHPTNPGYGPVAGIPTSILEYPFDTARAITSLLYNGVTVRCPDIRFIFSHAGGVAPFLSGRIEGPARMNPQLQKLLPNGALPELKKFYWDLALSANAPAIRALLALTDASKICFGSDYPFAPEISIAMAKGGMGALGLSAEQLGAMERGTALGLMLAGTKQALLSNQ